MTTFLARPTFERLAQVRTQLIDQGFAPATSERPGIAGLFLPWAGRELSAKGGVYWVGAGTDGLYGAERGQSYEACHERAARLCDRGPHARAHTPLWLFLDGLTRALLGGPYDATSSRWGWSNLLKIGWSVGSPDVWPPEVVERQQHACVAALREEIGQLRNSLVYVGSLDDFGILDEALGGAPAWHSENHKTTNIWWFRDKVSGNLIVHGNHPSTARREESAMASIERTILLAQNLLPRFM
jgi:hypothetical protein